MKNNNQSEIIRYGIAAMHNRIEAMEKLNRIEEEYPFDIFKGYGLMGVSFSSGNILALRRYTATSIGPGFTSVWHRNPQGIWTFYSDTDAMQSCERYYGKEVHFSIKTNIELSWSNAETLHVDIPSASLHWTVRLKENKFSTLVNRFISILPVRWKRNKTFIQWVGYISQILSAAGKIRFAGRTSNHYLFQANPDFMLTIDGSTAILNGETFGQPSYSKNQVGLGDFYIPRQGLFLTGEVYLEKHNASDHLTSTSIFQDVQNSDNQSLLNQYLKQQSDRDKQKRA